MRFSKWHALGNAYVLVEAPAAALSGELVRAVCRCDTGVGSDGVLQVTSRADRSAEVVIWNPDGSIAEMSGNGVRIAARWLGEEIGAHEVTITTAGRSVHARVLGGDDVEIDVGHVEVGSPETLRADGREVELTPVSVGNPHAVVRLDGATGDDLQHLGPAIETHARFPQRTNVQLVEPVGPNELRVLVWERGAGETSSSGSSATAAAAVAVAHGWCVSPVTVHLPGGDLIVTLGGDRATLLGPAVEICRGEITL